eukprot:5512879-Ditylum_brightwellii.AAC.1
MLISIFKNNSVYNSDSEFQLDLEEAINYVNTIDFLHPDNQDSGMLVPWPRRFGKTAVEKHTSVGEGPRARQKIENITT